MQQAGSIVKRKTLKQKSLLLKTSDLNNSRTLFQEINNFLVQEDESNQQPDLDNSFDDPLEAFGEASSILIIENNEYTKTQYSQHSNPQLQYIQEIFALFEKPLSYTSNQEVRSHLSTDCTSEDNYSSLNCSFNTYNQYYYEPSCYDQQPTIQENITANEIIPLKIDQDNRTTLMIRNIPGEYTREMLIEEVNQKFCSQYDFLNLPYDYKMQTNAGYAFINIKDKKSVKEFYNYYNGKLWRGNLNARPCYLRYAKVQGKRLTNYKRPAKQNFYYQKDNLSQIQQLVRTQRQQCNQYQ